MSLDLPWWARGRIGKPLGVFRAPWFKNWPAALYTTIVVSMSWTVLFIGRQPFGQVFGTGLLAGFAMGIFVPPVLTLLYPVKVYRHGLLAFDGRGGALSGAWDEMETAVEGSCAFVPGLEISLRDEGRELWLPLSIARDARFVSLVRKVITDDAHPLLVSLTQLPEEDPSPASASETA